jgi:hypothetical protein
MTSQPPSNPNLSERTRTLESVLLRRVASVGQARLAEHYGISESQFSRTKMERIGQAAEFIAALQLDLWPAELGSPDPEVHRACVVLARRFLHDSVPAEEIREEAPVYGPEDPRP